jgi:tetratricopeptide (TPR) repeat protein
MLGRVSEAADAYRRSREEFARLVAEFPGRIEYHQGLGGSWIGLGILFFRSGRSGEAESAFRHALAVYKQGAATFPERYELKMRMSGAHMSLAYVLRANRRHKEAAAERRHALAIAKRLVEMFPENPDYCEKLASIQFILSQDPQALTRSEREAAVRAALTLDESLVARFPTRADYRHRLAKDYAWLGHILRELNRPSDARDACRKAISHAKQVANDFPNRPEYQNNVAASLTALACVSMAQEPEQARQLLEEALRYSKVALDADPSNIDYLATFYENYASQVMVFLKLHDHAGAAAAADVAEPAYHTSDAIYELAVAYCICEQYAREDTRLSEARRKELRKSYRDRAMKALRRAVALGYKDVEKLKKDKALDPLRGLDDFKKLLADMEKAPK